MRHRARVLVVLVVALAPATLLRPATAAVTVTYGVVSWNPFHWVGMVGTAKGQFEKHGVKLDIPMTQARVDEIWRLIEEEVRR